MTEALVLQKQAPGEVYRHRVYADRLFENLWEPNRQYTVGDYVRPDPPNGYEYEATAVDAPSGTVGQSGASRPPWVKAIGETTADGSVTWTCRGFANLASDTIQTATVSFDAALTVGNVTYSATEVVFNLTGGNDGSAYTGTLTIVTADGQTIEKDLQITIED